MARRPVRYAMVDAFTDTPFKGNPAAVCLLEEEEDDGWMQAVASEFNASETAFLIPIRRAGALDSPNPRFHLRWFTPLAEVELCGHATLAAAHFLFTSGVVEGHMIEFDTKSGYLTTRKVHEVKKLGSSKLYTNRGGESFFIELDFPMIDVVHCEPNEIPSIPKTLNGLSIVSVQKTSTAGDLVVELASGKDLADLKPKFDEIEQCAQRGVIMTAPGPSGSGFDFFTRFFCPKLRIYEDPVCGSAHCALAPYWSKKLGKRNLVAYQASPRGGVLHLQLDVKRKKVKIQGEAVTVMAGTILA